jgi:calcium channel MID1
MQLSLLQSRLAASLVASCLLILLYRILFQPNFALAAELSEALPVIFDDLDFPTVPAPRSPLDPTYEAEFWPFDKSVIGRQQADIIKLTNDEPKPMNVEQGTSQHFVFELPAVSGREAEEDRLELRTDHNASWERNAGAGAAGHEVVGEQEEQKLATRQASRRVYISASTCLQPQPEDPSETKGEPSQLALYVSTTATNQRPGPLGDNETQTMVEFEEGAVMYNFTTDKEVYIGVHAPDLSESFSGIYNFRIAASIDNYYYGYVEQDEPELILVDTDSQGALLRTHDLTNSTDPALEQKLMSTKPYAVFAHNKEDRRINGVKRSYCGLYNYAQIAATTSGRQTNTVISSMTKRGKGNDNFPKQQFFFSGLNASAEYITILAKDGSDGNDMGKRQIAAERGPQIFSPMSFTTKSSKSPRHRLPYRPY